MLELPISFKYRSSLKSDYPLKNHDSNGTGGTRAEYLGSITNELPITKSGHPKSMKQHEHGDNNNGVVCVVEGLSTRS